MFHSYRTIFDVCLILNGVRIAVEKKNHRSTYARVSFIFQSIIFWMFGWFPDIQPSSVFILYLRPSSGGVDLKLTYWIFFFWHSVSGCTRVQRHQIYLNVSCYTAVPFLSLHMRLWLLCGWRSVRYFERFGSSLSFVLILRSLYEENFRPNSD